MEIVLVFGWFNLLIYFRCLVSGFSRLEVLHWELILKHAAFETRRMKHAAFFCQRGFSAAQDAARAWMMYWCGRGWRILTFAGKSVVLM
jgi:hypothetical protein